jgi:hypothetical protein
MKNVGKMPGRLELYEICVLGRLPDSHRATWFEGMTVTAQNGRTILRGSLPDQAALFGLLARLRDLALPLISVRLVEPDGE